jgi:arabinose-5-phosphate isomerase
VKNWVQPAPSPDDGANLDDAHDVIDAAIAMLESLRDMVDFRLLLAAQRIAACKGRLVISGVGKSGIAARKIASTCASLGTPSLFLHPTDAAHGDLGNLVAGDILLCISVSGESSELLSLLAHAQQADIASIAVTANAFSPLARLADDVLILPQLREGGPIPAVPMASTVATIVLGDALATLASKLKAFSPQQLAILHPSGRIGKILKPVQSIMHAGQRVPSVAPNAGLGDIAAEIGHKGFGVTAVVDPGSGALLGVISDGDLRRNIGCTPASTAADLMTADPQILFGSDSVDMALEILRNHRIGAIFVTEATGNRLIGIVHVQDLLRLAG